MLATSNNISQTLNTSSLYIWLRCAVANFIPFLCFLIHFIIAPVLLLVFLLSGRISSLDERGETATHTQYHLFPTACPSSSPPSFLDTFYFYSHTHPHLHRIDPRTLVYSSSSVISSITPLSSSFYYYFTIIISPWCRKEQPALTHVVVYHQTHT